MQLAPLALIIAGLASASEEECVCGNDKLQLWGPGGLHTALVPAALLFNVDAPSDQPLLEICWGPEATWREKALECGAGLFAGAEQQMGGFLRVYEAAGADSAAVAPITMQASVLIVPAGNPLGLTGLRDVIDRPELRVVVNDGNFRDSLTSATALWEIVVGRMGSVSATERVRAKIISFAAGSGEARDLILGGDADVWFSWLDWGVANPTGFDFVPIEREFAVARDLGLVPTNRTVEDGLVVGAFIEFLQRSPEANAVMELAGWFKEGALDSPQNMLAARAPAPAPPAVDPLACSVMCGNVTRTGEAWQLCVPGFFQWSLEKSSGVGLASAPLSLKRMEAGGFAGTSFIVPQKVKGKHYQLFYRQSKSMAQGKSWSIWQRLTTAPPNTSTPADLHGPPTCGPVCGDVAFSKAETVAGRDGWQEFCQAGMLKGELEPYNISIGPKTTGLKFPYHLQKLLKMTPGTFGPVEHVLLESEAGNGRMLFRQGLHADGWTAIFQQRFIPALGDNGTAADAAVKTSDDEARVIAASNTSAALTITDFWNGDAHFELISKSAFPEYGMRAMNVGFHFVTRPNGTWFLFHREYNFAPRPEYCIADWARIVVRKSTNQGRNWSDAHPIATPSGPFPSSGNVTDKPQAPDECALTDGSGYYDEKAETWHYLSQCNNRTRHWMLCHYSKKGTDPMAGGLWTINDKNPVVLPGQLWSQICAGGVAAGKACDGAEDGGHGTHDEGTPEIVRSDDKGFHYVTFHGCNDWANRSARGVARTRDFVEWETHGEGLPGDAIFGQVDCNQWNVSGGWADGTCVGGGEGSIIVADDGFMYQLIEAPDVNLGCHTKEGEQNWVLGLLRSKTFSKAGTWEQFGSSGGTSPTVVPYVKEGCFIQYHRLFADDQGTYLEYWAGFGSGWMQIHGLKPGKGTLPIVATDKVLEPWKSDDESPSLTSLLEHDAPGNDGLGIDDGDGADPRGPGNALFCDVAGPACWAPPEEPESTSAAGSPFILLQDSAAAEAYAAGSPGNVSLVPSLSGLWAKRARTAGLATRAVWDISCTALLGCSDTRLEHPQPFPDVARGSPGGLSAVMWVQGRPIHQNDVYATLLNSSTSPHPSGVQASVGSSGEHMELSFLTALAGRPHNITLSTAGCGAASLFDGKAHQVAFLLDGATRLASLMVDDSLCAVSATGWAAWPEGATAANLRHFHATYNERGLVRLRVYPRTLCSSEVLGSFFAGPTTPPALSAGASVHSTRQEVPKLKTDDCFGAATVLRHSIITVFLAPHVSAPTLRSVDLDNALTRALAWSGAAVDIVTHGTSAEATHCTRCARTKSTSVVLALTRIAPERAAAHTARPASTKTPPGRQLARTAVLVSTGSGTPLAQIRAPRAEVVEAGSTKTQLELSDHAKVANEASTLITRALRAVGHAVLVSIKPRPVIRRAQTARRVSTDLQDMTRRLVKPANAGRTVASTTIVAGMQEPPPAQPGIVRTTKQTGCAAWAIPLAASERMLAMRRNARSTATTLTTIAAEITETPPAQPGSSPSICHGLDATPETWQDTPAVQILVKPVSAGRTVASTTIVVGMQEPPPAQPGIVRPTKQTGCAAWVILRAASEKTSQLPVSVAPRALPVKLEHTKPAVKHHHADRAAQVSIRGAEGKVLA